MMTVVDPDLIICRCEGVSLKELRRTLESPGIHTANQLKKLTRAGMGPCQGKTCGRLLEFILQMEKRASMGEEPLQARVPVRGAAIGSLAGLAEEFFEPAGPVAQTHIQATSPSKNK